MKERKFGKLTVLEEVGSNNRGILYECSCECGNHRVFPGKDLRSGNNKSCGCLNHGMSGTRIYEAWSNMKRRCNDSNNKSYTDYGLRGITYDDEWEEFNNFFRDMQEGYKDDLTLDRIDVNGNYCKSNCRWVSMTEQANNKTNNHIVEYKGEKLTTTELGEKYNADTDLVRQRINRGWSVERALNEEKWENITYKDVTKPVKDFAKDYGLTYHQLKKRLIRGWTIERALNQPLRKRRN